MNKQMQCINNHVCTTNLRKLIDELYDNQNWYRFCNPVSEISETEHYYVLSIVNHIVAFIEKRKLTRFDVRNFYIFDDSVSKYVRQAIRKFFLMYSGSDGIQFTYKDIF